MACSQSTVTFEHVDDLHVARDPWRGVHNAIRDSIIAGEYPPDSRLVEQQLADRFGTSRGPVRTALQELERSGLVVSIDRRGTFVRSVSDVDVEEIFSLWDVIWDFAIRRAAGRIGPEEQRWFDEFLAQDEPDDPAAVLERGIEFGRQVFRMARHSRALEIYETLLIQAQARSLFIIAASQPGHGKQESPYIAVGAALARGDADAASAASEAWMAESRNYWLGRAQASAGDGASGVVAAAT